ncbi:alpha/beta hydrolase [Flavobacterium marginilacus]|uniref:alpha/beta hydrolase n=1 Tax=Flavobacterium marginilacus TaxID=3003256 RepID=UPI00248EE148|nr:alpha/beta fold hydrolase [Flavobacterium marginilacus]
MEILKTIRFVLIVTFSVIAVIYIFFVSYIYFNQEEIIFAGSKLPENYKFQYQQEFEEINVKSFDGKKLNGLLFKAKESKGIVFYLHGNSGSLDTWGDIASIYTDLGYDIFILDYRGFGKSEGKIENEQQVLKDLSFAYKNILERYEEKDVVIIGYSIGTGFAAWLASKNKPKMLILQSPYYNFLEFSNTRIPYIPDLFKKFKIETNLFLANVKVPVFIFHGKQDYLIPIENSVRLSKLLHKESHFYPLENQDHLLMNQNADYKDKLKILMQK